MVDTSGYKQQVHRSLLQRDLAAGIPQTGLLLLFILGVIFIYGLRLFISAVPIVLLYFIMRHLTKIDQFFIDIVIENIQQKDRFIP